jgi:hypothetical protein
MKIRLWASILGADDYVRAKHPGTVSRYNKVDERVQTLDENVTTRRATIFSIHSVG